MQIEVRDFTFQAINLWAMPRLYIVELVEEFKEGKRHVKTVVKPNPQIEKLLKER
jgi:hypothetical protein